MEEREPMPVKLIKNLLIPMSDGVRLAADLFLPEGEGRYPAIVTFFPYHKDGRGGRDNVEVVHQHFARRGYAALTVDIRGLGSSEGVNHYPFDPQEREDGHQVVEWVAAQTWCTGEVGLWGVSYGGITSLSVASTRPPHLKAIVPIHAGADIYEDFLRLGGCRGGFWSEGDWGPRMLAYNLMPPLFEDDEGRWASIWQERLEKARPWILSWHEHPDYDDFWAQRAIPYERIQAPTFAICGWNDLYPTSTSAYYQGIAAPKRLLMGPWKHAFPDIAGVEPVGGLYEMERWFDRWLKGIANGVEAAPPVIIYVQGRGEWRQEAAWPLEGATENTLYLGSGGTLSAMEPTGEVAPDVWQHDPTVGPGSLPWDPWTGNVPFAADQSFDDHRSVSYTTDPLASDVEAIGTPRVALHVASSAEEPNLVVKLCDVAPDGSSALVSMGWLQGRRHSSRTAPSPMVPGKVYEVAVDLRPTAYLFPAGHRIRLCVAGADFPRLWPVPRAFTLQVHHSSPFPSHLALPVVTSPPVAATLPPPATGLQAPAHTQGEGTWEVRRGLAPATATLVATRDDTYRIDRRTTMRIRHQYTSAVESTNPQEACVQAGTRVDILRPVNGIVLETQTVQTTHHLRIVAEITVDGKPFFARRWETRA